MAKKTNYLTELIERHERWKAEGGEQLEKEERDTLPDLYARPSRLVDLIAKMVNRILGRAVAILKTYGTLALCAMSVDRGRSDALSKFLGLLSLGRTTALRDPTGHPTRPPGGAHRPYIPTPRSRRQSRPKASSHPYPRDRPTNSATSRRPFVTRTAMDRTKTKLRSGVSDESPLTKSTTTRTGTFLIHTPLSLW
jgi:hypothetical protein